MNILEKLFGGPARVKVLRYFLQNPHAIITKKELVHGIQVSSAAASREIRFLKILGLLKDAKRADEARKGKRLIKKKVFGFSLNTGFPLRAPLYALVVGAAPVSREKITHYFKTRPSVQLVALGGMFVQEQPLFQNDDSPDVRLDLLVVGTKVKRGALEPFIRKIEAEIGRELTWALFSVSEFEQRLAMHDKFLRDLFDYPHEILINKLGV